MKVFLILIVFYSSLFAKDSFTSEYTNISKDCKYDSKDIQEGQDAPLICNGPSGYTVIISYSACMENLRIESKNKKESIDMPSQPIGSAETRKLEWRLLNKKPIGVIYRTFVLKDSPNGNCPQEKTKQETLEVRGLGKYLELNTSIASGKNANEKARDALESFVIAKK
ncbi:MAG TPA: hypothetical protein PK079_20745 [Leptospiraceae bacterium]|nr:hypothetical protein [Leptospiraceae bacterium]HMW04136.1 hypothetical protein [Leptospiraceae bacterium]HMX30797.1 hypothetical protein [Leptospiraceae bacterium]HMY30129.1 hypothetical protein [Leptospiraceae bacterium]HMZ64364.1 hypothetical protein [Leptospiraceae bacterium]